MGWRNGYFGLVAEVVRPEDIVCILLGGRMPVVLRLEGDHFLFVGECFIHGVMLGETMEGLEMGKYDLQDFQLH